MVAGRLGSSWETYPRNIEAQYVYNVLVPLANPFSSPIQVIHGAGGLGKLSAGFRVWRMEVLRSRTLSVSAAGAASVLESA